MKTISALVICVVVVSLAGCTSAKTLQATFAHAEIDWADVSNLSDSDKADIVELAQNLGMHNPSRASELRLLPSGDKIFVISTNIIVSGLRRTWREIYLCRLGEYCSTLIKESVGDWGVYTESREQERWRFSDGNWVVDIELGSGISYAEAESIILAIHRNLLVNTSELKDSELIFEASNISSIRTRDPIASEFTVYIGNAGGYVLQVRLRGSEVQLYELVIVTA